LTESRQLTNKKLFEKIEKLEKQLELTENERYELRERLDDLSDKHGHILEVYRTLELHNNDLKENKQKNQIQIESLREEGNRFKRTLEERDKTIKNLDNERLRLTARLEDLGFENNNLSTKLKGKEDNLLLTSKQLDEARQNINTLQVTMNMNM
jgi:chromosome segregation ATPase